MAPAEISPNTPRLITGATGRLDWIQQVGIDQNGISKVSTIMPPDGSFLLALSSDRSKSI